MHKEQSFKESLSFAYLFYISVLFMVVFYLFSPFNYGKIVSSFLNIFYFSIYFCLALILLLATINYTNYKKAFKPMIIIIYLLFNLIVGLHFFTPEFISHSWYDQTQKILLLNAASNFSKSTTANLFFILMTRPWRYAKDTKGKIIICATIIIWGYLLSALFYISPLGNQSIE